ncbi:MAG: ABC transporter ATP-binding protein [Actinobacteria bacterium]|nr:ABC transporter ATP-binding protein [Actinomycetota bacterium]
MAVEVKGISKSYRSTAEVVVALKDVSFTVPKGQIVALMGPSGSGKTTLLNILAGWESADAGSVELRSDGGSPRDVIRWSDLASIPQRLGLSEELTVRENVELPLILHGVVESAVTERVDAVLEALDLSVMQDRLPSEISLGEQQRTSVARAVVVESSLVLADEPTGNQDSLRTEKVVGAMRRLSGLNTASVIATHDPLVASLCDRVLRMHDGELVSDESIEHAGWRRR